MADPSDPMQSGSSAGDSASVPSAEWCAEQWSVLCEVLDVSDPTEVVPEVRALKNDEAPDELASDEVKEAFQEMYDQLESLRDRNEELLDRLQSASDAPTSVPDDEDGLHPETEALLDQLNASSLSEAQARIESLNEQINHLYREKEQLAEAGLMSAEEALDEIDRLQKKCDRLAAQQDGPSPPSGSSVAAELDLDTPDAAHRVASLATEANEALTAAIDNLDIESSPPLSSTDTFPATLRALYERAATLRDETASHQGRTDVADVLGIETAEEAQELEQIVRRMGEQLDTLLDERETLLDELGVSGAGDVLDLVRSLEGQLVTFYDRQQQDASQQKASGEQLASQIEEILGISSVEEAHELEGLVRQMNERLEQVSSTHEVLAEAGYDAETAIATINNMEEQLVALYGEREASLKNGRPPASGAPAPSESANTEKQQNDALVEAVTEVLGLSTPAEVRQMNESVRRMSTHLDTLQAEHEALSEAGLTAEDALLMLENMSDQLSSLYQARDERTEALSAQIASLGNVLGIAPPADAVAPETALEQVTEEAAALLATTQDALPSDADANTLADALNVLASPSHARAGAPHKAEEIEELEAIRDVLGIADAHEAKELASLAENMSAQLESLYADRERLHDIGVSSVESAVDMIQSMSDQLDELYEEQELLQDRSSPVPSEEQDTFEQLASLYSEQEKLERALGVSSADEVIDMVETLTDQLEAVYSDEEESPDDGPSIPTTMDLDSTTANGTDADDAVPAEVPSSMQPVFSSMQEQLESLYAEKEALLDLGINDARKAASRIDELEARLNTLQHEYDDCRGHLERLKSELGTTSIPKIVEMVETASDPSPTSFDDRASTTAPSSSPSETPPPDDVPSLLPDDTLNALDQMPEADLDDLSVGVMRIDDEGRIEYLNEAALTVPGLETADRDDLHGNSLFQTVPSTSNTLFLDRFRTGLEQGHMDTRFPYTFVSPKSPPTAFFVHLYRATAAGKNWLLLTQA